MKQSSKLLFYNWMTKILPAANICQWLRKVCLKWAGVQLGEHVELGDGVVMRGDGQIRIGNHVKLYDDVYVLCKPGGSVVVGDDVCLATRVYIESGGVVEIGDRSYVMQESLLTANCGSRLSIGCDCQIAHMVSLKTSTHDIDTHGVCIAGAERFDDIDIGDGVWLCAGVIVIPGVKIGKKSVVAAGAVVTDDVDSGRMVAGVPAVEKKRF